MNFKQKAIAALEELKGDCTGIIAATIEDCQKVIGDIPGDTAMTNDARFAPGTPVWVIERDEDGNAADVSGYVFLAQCNKVGILSSYINSYDFKGILDYHIQCTAEDYDTHLCVFPVDDCYSGQEECEAAFRAEQEGTMPGPMRRYNVEIKTIIDSLKYCSVNGSICRECPNYNQDSGCLDRLHAAAADLLESQQKRIADLEEKNRWIPVTERLPGTECLAISMIPGKPFYKEQLVGYIGECGRSESGYMCESDDQMLMNVTHWKCPEPPKEGT